VEQDFSQIDGNLWVGACPADELPASFPYVLNLYRDEAYLISPTTEHRLHILVDEPVIPDPAILIELADWVNDKRALGPTLVHCQAGLNRSGLIAGLALVRAGMAPSEAIALLRARRSPDVLFNAVFERWLLDLADHIA
jgi:protein-tyrosine phosphatase